MKKSLLSLLAMGFVIGVNAQVVEVNGLKEVKTSLPVDIAKVSPDGNYVIVSDVATNALHKINLSDGATSVVTNNGSALELQFSPDSRAVVFKRSITGDKRMRMHSVETVDLTTGAERQIAKPARHGSNFTVSARGNLTISNENGIARTMSLAGKEVKEAPKAVVGINKGHLELTTADGVTKFLDPQGKGSYLWPSISPDGTKIVYFKSGAGCFVCDIDGSNVRKLGYVHAPVWLNNEAIIGCQDFDNGVTVTASAIVAADLNGTIQTLTNPSLLGMSPSASADGKTVSFGTADGKLYILTLK